MLKRQRIIHSRIYTAAAFGCAHHVLKVRRIRFACAHHVLMIRRIRFAYAHHVLMIRRIRFAYAHHMLKVRRIRFAGRVFPDRQSILFLVHVPADVYERRVRNACDYENHI